MKYTIDIDNGGTFTDGFFTAAGRIEWVKVDTTPHDLTVCFLKCIEEGAARFGVILQQFLRDIEVIRFSTTHATNTLIQRSGPRLGLIVTRGFEESLYAKSGRSPVLDTIIAPAMVTSIDPPDKDGQPDREQVRAAIRVLLGRGARMIVVSLSGSHNDPRGELNVQAIADDDYPRHYLGAVPLLLSHEVSTTTDEASRTNVALLNAYFHPDMVRFLYKAEDDVRALGYRKPLLVTHADGGVARVAKTTAIMTHNSGPSAGIMGTSFMSRYYSLPCVASLDIGGTSADISLVINGTPGYKRETEVEGIPVKLPLIEVYPAAAGGGSIARAGKKAGIRVGPDSAGAMPGPACYGLGGADPTSTDACVALGYIDPNYFLGGKRTLDAALAKEAITENLAKPLGLSVEECGRLVMTAMEDICAGEINKLIKAGGYNPADFVLFSFGGGGGTYAAGIADKVGIPKVYCFRFSSVFSAFGSSCADILHTYESLARITLRRDADAAQVKRFNAVVAELQKDLLRDMRGEGFTPDKVTFSLELETEGAGVVFDSPAVLLEKPEDTAKVLDAAGEKSGGRLDEIKLRLFRLRASSPVAHPEFPAARAGGKSPAAALLGKRDVYWKDSYIQTPIYAQGKLQNGNVIAGPAIIESDDTTIVIPGGKKYTVGPLLNGVIESA